MFRQFRRGVGAVIYARYDGYSVARAGAAARANQHPTKPRSGPLGQAVRAKSCRDQLRNSQLRKQRRNAKNGQLPFGWSVKLTPAKRVCQPPCQAKPHLIG
jgi:hypothetical protein